MMLKGSDLNSGMRCIKYFLVVINVLFVVSFAPEYTTGCGCEIFVTHSHNSWQTTSLLMITVGRTVQSIFGEFSEFLEDGFTYVPTLLIVCGAVMLVVAAFGVFGAIRESTLLTNIVSQLTMMMPPTTVHIY